MSLGLALGLLVVRHAPNPDQQIMTLPIPFLMQFSSHGLSRASILSAFAVVGLIAGCQVGPIGTTEGDANQNPIFNPGVIVQCGSDGVQPRLVCMSHEDFKCPYSGYPKSDDVYYVRRALCAEAWGGSPVDYTDKPHPIDGGVAQEPLVISGDGAVDCAFWMGTGEHAGNSMPKDDPETFIDESTAIVKNRFFPPNLEHQCDACRVCDLQNYGWSLDGYPDDRWNEYPWCPGKGDGQVDQGAFAEFWANGCVLSEDPTGGEATSGGEDATGGAPEPGIFVCNGAQTICGKMLDTSTIPSQETTYCMWGGLVPPCVLATTATAQDECHDYCLGVDGSYANQASDDLDPFGYKSWSGLPCDSVYQFEAVQTQDPKNDCAGGGYMPSLSVALPFVAMIDVSNELGSSSRETVAGTLEVESDDSCSKGATSCAMTISKLSSHASVVDGVFEGRSKSGSITSSLPFTLADLEVHLVQPSYAVYSPHDGNLSFPSDSLYFSVSVGELLLGGVTMSDGIDATMFKVSGIKGTWDGQRLSLEIETRKAGVSIRVRVNAG